MNSYVEKIEDKSMKFDNASLSLTKDNKDVSGWNPISNLIISKNNTNLEQVIKIWQKNTNKDMVDRQSENRKAANSTSRKTVFDIG